MKHWSEKIPYIKELKDFYSGIEHKGINLWPVMAGDVYTYYYFSHIDKIEEPKKIKRFFIGLKSLFFGDKFEIKGNGKILVSYFMHRKDHYDLIKSAVSYFPEGDLIWIDSFKYKQKNILFRWSIIFPNIFLLLRIWFIFRKKKLKKILKNYYWFYILKTYSIYNQIDNLEKIIYDIKPRAYISFCSSAFDKEAILTLLCKKNSVPTFTLQHGFFSDKTKNFYSSIVQNENIISDYLLLWGKSSYEIQKGYVKDKSRLLIVGNPKYNSIRRSVKKFNPRICTFFFSVPAYRKNNIKILKILNFFAQKHPKIVINLKLHPFDNIKNYQKFKKLNNIKFVDKKMVVSELLKKSDFVIVHNTSVAYEALLYRIPILRFKDKFFADLWKNPDTFKNFNELENLFLKFKNKKTFNKFINFYEKERKKHFYFESGKSTPQIYYETIMKKIAKKNYKNNNSLKPWRVY
ncbi:MAG: hypothetical protein QXU39_00775 [Candidatus Pacearchaeota archaeon]